ncbi:MAG: hypothetical protein QNJ46_27510 [Leptolyngbyaceae cyanobacterium MO_188.B28]|nr:hypothetical protein [Leptolyngbyaceae cyanobacterium MO_188.B28]
MRTFLAGPLVAFLLVVSAMSPAIAGRRYSPVNPCTTRFISEDAHGNVIVTRSGVRRRRRPAISHQGRTVISHGSPSQTSRLIRIERICHVNIRRIRAETAACGFNQYSQPRVGEFRRSEWRRNNRVVYSETELVRCF